MKGINDITIELKESEDKNVSLKAEKQALDAQIKDLLSNSNNSSEQLDKLSEDNAKLTSKMEKIKEEKSESKQKLLKMENELDQLRNSSAKEI